MKTEDVTAERVARNQAAFREANEKIDAVASEFVDAEEEVPALCECARRDCTELTRVTRVEYESVRASGRTFLVVPGHETTQVDGIEVARIVEQHDRFSVMEKIGDAGAIAEELDPRSGGDGR